MGMFDKDKDKDAAEKAEQKKTTPDEGKTFDKDTVFECVTDTFQNCVRYRRGDMKVGRQCPPHFKVNPDIKPENLEDKE